MGSSDISITVCEGALENGAPALLLKIQTDMFELNVWVPENEISLLNQVQSASWDTRESLRIGRSANSPVFWSCSEVELAMLVGHDDETWDFALRLPHSALEQILSAIEAEQTASRDRKAC